MTSDQWKHLLDGEGSAKLASKIDVSKRSKRLKKMETGGEVIEEVCMFIYS